MLEQEIKLTAPNRAVLQQILQSELVQSLDSGVGNQDAVRYVGVYYDTECGALARQRCTLRARLEGDRWRAAFKFGGGIRNGLSRRHELEADITGWLRHVEQLPAGELKDKVRAVIPSATSLNARVKVNMQRSIRQLNFSGAEIELVADHAIIHANGGQVTLYEVELELKRGDLADLLQLGEMFMQQFPLTRSTMGKHRIGLQLNNSVASNSATGQGGDLPMSQAE